MSGISRRLNRRRFLRGAALTGAGLGAAALLGCSSDDDPPGANGASVGTSSPTVTADGNVARGGTLRFAMGGEPTSMDPHRGTGGGDHHWAHLLYDQVVAYNQQGLPDPSISLAEKWEYADDTTIIMDIRRGVTMNGSDEVVDAELIAWNLDRARDPISTPSTDLQAIESVEVVDDYQVRINLSEVSAPLLTNMGDRGGFVVSRRDVEALGDDGFARQPRGSGLFSISQWHQDALVEFEASTDHWRTDSTGARLPFLDKISIAIVPDETVRVAGFETGETDIYNSVPALDRDRLLSLPGVQRSTFVGSSTARIMINGHTLGDGRPSHPLNNWHFRKAMDLGADVQSAINNLEQGDEPLARGVLTPASAYFSEEVPERVYDPAEARKLLDASGVPPEEWVLTGSANGDTLSELHQYWEAAYADYGITIDWGNRVRRSASADFFFKGFGGTAEAQVHVVGWSMRVDPDGNLGPHWDEQGTYNAGYWPHPEIQDLIQRARSVHDFEERRELYTRAEILAREDVFVMMPHYYRTRLDLAAENVGHLENLHGGEGKYRWGLLSIKA